MTAVIAGLTEPTDLCDAGFVCVSGANNSRPTDVVTGYECPPGYYCPSGSDQETGCPQGSFSNVLGLESTIQCENCTTGMYCATEGEQLASLLFAVCSQPLVMCI